MSNHAIEKLCEEITLCDRCLFFVCLFVFLHFLVGSFAKLNGVNTTQFVTVRTYATHFRVLTCIILML